MSFGTLSLIALDWKQPKCPSTGEYTSRLLSRGHKVEAVSPGLTFTLPRQEDVGSKGLFPNKALLYYLGKWLHHFTFPHTKIQYLINLPSIFFLDNLSHLPFT